MVSVLVFFTDRLESYGEAMAIMDCTRAQAASQSQHSV
jgi:hypothetical protein